MSYAHLHAHTEYTLTDGSMRIDEYLDRVEELGIPSAAVTDTHNLFGAFKFHEKALGRGIKPIIGVDLRVSDEVRTAVTGGMSTKRMRVFIQNRAGYRRLSHLISESYRRRSEGELFVPLSLIHI